MVVHRTMQRSKSIALAFLAGALIVGGALGFTAERLVGRTVPPTRREMRQRLADELRLRADQRHAVDSILDARNRDFDATLSTVRPRMDSIRDKARHDIRQLLDADQRQRFEAFLNAEQRSYGKK